MRRLVCGVLLVLLAGAARAGEGDARCGRGFLERMDGYPVLHLRGTPYEMGWQHGTLLKEECRALLHHLLVVKNREATVSALGIELTPRDAISLIARLSAPFIPARHVEEMRGLADALEVPYEDMLAANLVPELFHCSGFALLSRHTADGTVLHGRVLDYATDWRLQEHAVLVVQEPKDGIAFANVTYAGFVGSVTGLSAERISVGEMGGRGLGLWMGTPMSFLVRRVLEEARSLDEALAVFRDSRRTCQYFYVIADGEADDAAGIEAGARRFTVLAPGQSHPLLPLPVPGTVLLSAGDRYRELAGRVARRVAAGRKFTAKDALRLMDAPVAMRGNLHNVLMAPGLGRLWVANASPDGRPAWTQPYRKFDLADLLRREAPGAAPALAPPPSR